MYRLTAVLLLWAGLAQAQVKPEFTLMIDTTAGMNDGGSCAPDNTPARANDFNAAGVAFSANYLHMVKDALLGTRNQRGDLFCVDVQIDGQLHQRAYCGQNNLRPCDDDHGDVNSNFSNGDTQHRRNDGLLKANQSDFLFGLMTPDVDPGAANDAASGFSYGDNAPNEVGFNLGIRSRIEANGAPHFGPLIEPHKGRNTGPQVRPDEDATAAVVPHNRWLADHVGRLYVEGERAPLAAMLRDAVAYYDSDDELGCRERNLILITRGVEGHGRTDNNLDQAACEARFDTFSNENGQPWCEGAAPHAPSWTFAEELRALGVKVFVIRLGPAAGAGDPTVDKLMRIAQAGSPGVKPDGSAGYYSASSEAEFRAAFTEILNLESPAYRGRARPLVIIPGKGDVPPAGAQDADDDIRQWRFIARSQVSKDEAVHYGELEEQRLGCDEARADEDAPGALVDFTSYRFDQILRSQVTRRAFTRQIAANLDRHVALMGGQNAPVFNQVGVSLNNYSDPEIEAMVGDEVPPAATGAFLNGYFGERGAPGGQVAPTNLRQLAALTLGDIVAIPPPNLGIANPAYLLYEQEHSERPTLVALGANDGMIHFFHAITGAEFFNFIPAGTLGQLSQAAKNVGHEAYAYLDVADLALCRTLGEGGGVDCPSDPGRITFGTFVVGALMNGDGLFGLNLTELNADPGVEAALNGPANLRTIAPKEQIWNLLPGQDPTAKLGATTSRPQLTHVRVEDKVKAAVVIGCGEDTGANADADDPDAVGRCALVIDMQTGEVIQTIDKRQSGDDLNRPLIGSPAVFPAGGISTAEFVYIGDSIGRIWRVDLRDSDKANWKAEITWPPEDEDDLSRKYKTGSPIVGRPSVVLRENGQRVIVFASAGDSDANVQSTIVSFSEGLADDGNGNAVVKSTPNWVFPLGVNEVATEAPVVRDGIALFTTKREVDPNNGNGNNNNADICSSPTAEGRLIGVDYLRAYVDADGDPAEFTYNGQRVSVLPALPLTTGDGSKALALVLPPGRVAYGLTIVATPSCLVGGVPAMEVILNLSDESTGGAGAVSTNEMKVETVDNGQVQQVAFDNQIFSKGKGQTLSVCLNCNEDGAAQATGGSSRSTAPFPSTLLYWGASFSD